MPRCSKKKLIVFGSLGELFRQMGNNINVSMDIYQGLLDWGFQERRRRHDTLRSIPFGAGTVRLEESLPKQTVIAENGRRVRCQIYR